MTCTKLVEMDNPRPHPRLATRWLTHRTGCRVCFAEREREKEKETHSLPPCRMATALAENLDMEVRVHETCGSHMSLDSRTFYTCMSD